MLNQLNAGVDPYAELIRNWNRNLEKFEYENEKCHEVSTCMIGLCIFLPCSIFYYKLIIWSIIMNQRDIYEILIGYVCVGGMFIMFICLMIESIKSTKRLKNERYAQFVSV